jgi:hypothetical protein
LSFSFHLKNGRSAILIILAYVFWDNIVSEDMVFYYMTRDSLCFLTMCESRYPKRLAFLYLDEIGDVVLSELAKEFDNSVSKCWDLLSHCSGARRLIIIFLKQTVAGRS